jgi:hypothetical protein
MSPGMEKLIDHGRPSDVHGTSVMENVRPEKSPTLNEKVRSKLMRNSIFVAGLRQD